MLQTIAAFDRLGEENAFAVLARATDLAAQGRDRLDRAGGRPGDVERPGNYEIPLGTPFAKLLELAGGVRKGRKLKAVIPGGSSTPVMPCSWVSKLCSMPSLPMYSVPL